MPLMDALLERCQVCKGKTHVVFDELIGAEKGEEAGPGRTCRKPLCEGGRAGSHAAEGAVRVLAGTAFQMYPL